MLSYNSPNLWNYGSSVNIDAIVGTVASNTTYSQFNDTGQINSLLPSDSNNTYQLMTLKFPPNATATFNCAATFDLFNVSTSNSDVKFFLNISNGGQQDTFRLITSLGGGTTIASAQSEFSIDTTANPSTTVQLCAWDPNNTQSITLVSAQISAVVNIANASTSTPTTATPITQKNI